MQCHCVLLLSWFPVVQTCHLQLQAAQPAHLHACRIILCCLAQDAPFFTVKLNVKVLPCVVLFSGGVAVDRAVGFDEFGAKDDFPTEAVERRLLRR